MTHQWREYDPFHRACERCGLRVFMRHSEGRVRGWQTIDWRGMPGALMLTGKGEPGGVCVPPAAPPIPEPVIIEYTGDPDQHPGCERVMHVAGGLGGAAGLVAVTELRAACGASPLWWELGPARKWDGWNWCAACFPTRKPHHVPPSERERLRAQLEREREEKHRARLERAADKRKALKAEAGKLRFPIPLRWCPTCPGLSKLIDLGSGKVVRVAKGELAGLVLLVCSRCAPRKG